MKQPIFKGSAAALVTPFQENGAIDIRTLKELIGWQMESGTDALVVCATTGECTTLTDLEWETIVSIAVETCSGKIPVIAGAGKNDTSHAIRLYQRAKILGADGILAVTPYYNKTTQAGLIRHYTSIADSSDLPILLYNVPSRTGLSFRAETYAVLAGHPNIYGVKEASGDFSLILKTRKLCPQDFAIYSGNDDQIIPILSLGGMGVISTMANVIPQKTHDICALYSEGNMTDAAALSIDCQPLIEALFCEVNPIPVKRALSLMKKCSDALRLPLTAIGETANAQLIRAMKDLALIS